MYSVYAVVIDGNKNKHRHFLNLVESLAEAKHLANCATCGNAAYAYVKDSRDDSTVFFLKRPPVKPSDPNPYALKGPARLRPIDQASVDWQNRRYPAANS